jgi:hypothetical protein
VVPVRRLCRGRHHARRAGLTRAREFDVGTPVYVKLLTAAELRKALKLSP